MNAERTTYRERSPWPGFATAILWGVVVLTAYPILAGWEADFPFPVRFAMAAGIVALAVALQIVVGGLTVRVQETRLFIHLGSVPLVKRTVPYAEIQGVRSIEYRPLREFGGWGVRGIGKRKAWTARGNQAVELTFTDGRRLLVGSDHPQRLEERIRAVAGDQLAVS